MVLAVIRNADFMGEEVIRDAAAGRVKCWLQLADGFPNLPGPSMVTHQPQCRFESQARVEQPTHHDGVHALGDAVAILRQAQSHPAESAAPPL